MKQAIKILLLLGAQLGIPVASSALADGQVEYKTDCRIENGEATGYVSITSPSSHSFSGKVWFTIYDEDYEEIDREWELAIVTVIGSDWEEVESTDVDDDGVYCHLDLSEAIGEPENPPPSENEDFTTCQIRDGRAYGYFHLRSQSSLSFSGKVWFTIYDDDGDEIDREWETAIVIVIGRDPELVEDIRVDDDAYSCYLDVSEAIE